MNQTCPEHETLRADIEMIKISTFETSRTVEQIKTNHLKHLQDGQVRLEQTSNQMAQAIKDVRWIAMASIGVVAIGIALIAALLQWG